MILSPNPKLHFTDSNGKPLAGGTLSTYTGSSTNPVQTYQDYAGTVLNPVHITLDARGECQVFLNPSVVYIFVLKDKNGTEIYTVNGVTASGHGSSLGSNISITSTDSSVTITSTVATDGSIVYNLSIQNQIDAINTAITTEADARATADSTLQTNLNNEITSREQADSNLQNQIDNIGSYTASAPISITNKVITHDQSGVQPGTYGDTNNSRGLLWGDTFKVNANTIDKYGHVTSATETNLTLPSVTNPDTNYLIGYFAGGIEIGSTAVYLPISVKSSNNMSVATSDVANGFTVSYDIKLLDVSIDVFGYYQDSPVATEQRTLSISIYDNDKLLDWKNFTVEAWLPKIELPCNFKIKNTAGHIYSIKMTSDSGTFKTTNFTDLTAGARSAIRINDESANSNFVSSGLTEVYHDDTMTGKGTTSDPLTVVPGGTLPIATSTTLGGVKVGSNLSISTDGTLSADAQSQVQSNWNTTDTTASSYIQNKPTTVSQFDNDSGFVTSSTLSTDLATKQDKLTAGSNVSIVDNVISATDTIYTLPIASSSTLGGIKVGSNLSISDGVLSAVAQAQVQANWNTTDTTAYSYILNKPTTVSQFTNDAGYITSTALTTALSTKQDTLTAGSNISITNNVISATNTTYTLPSATTSTLGGVIVGNNLSITSDGTLSADISSYDLVAGSNITLTEDNTAGTITIAGTAEPYTLPTASATVLGGIKVGDNLSITDGVLSATSYTLPTATADTLGGVKIGSNLSITDGVLSATGSGYTAGTNITITDYVIASPNSVQTTGTNTVTAVSVVSTASEMTGTNILYFSLA